ncbi:MAG: hypothetical protein R3246_08795 [Acidimicrobiia bacterium]|nr:hypothetical protein [Acidimicrobiia bacterium]
MAAGALVAFGIVATAVGLVLALGDGGRVVQQVGFAFYAAGAPVSGLFAALAGDLPLAPFTDIVVWLALAVGTVRISERRGVPIGRVLAGVIAFAACFGVVVSFLIERA